MALLLFEPQTAKLTDYERELVPVLVKCLENKVGKNKAVKNSYMVAKLREHGLLTSEPRIRKMLNYIRTKGLVECLVASSQGYYISTDIQELDDYIDSLRGREDAIREVRLALEEQRVRLEDKQNNNRKKQ